MEQRTFNQLLTAAVKNGASDIHLRAGAPPALRINGNLLPVKVPALAPEDTQQITDYVLTAVHWQGDATTLKDLDTSYSIPDVGRFRVNVFRTKGELGLILRVIPPVVPTCEMPPL